MKKHNRDDEFGYLDDLTFDDTDYEEPYDEPYEESCDEDDESIWDDEPEQEEEEYLPVKVPKTGTKKKKVNSKRISTKKSAAKKTPVKKKSATRKKTKRKKRGENGFALFIQKIGDNLGDMSTADRIVLSTGVIVLAVAILTGSIYLVTRSINKQVSTFSELGEQLGAVSVNGESGLIAVTDAQVAAMNAQIVEETESIETETEEEESKGENEVLLNMTSVEKDLKIKFINKATGKLISGIPFKVNVTGPDKKTQSFQDKDKDGIIYNKDIAAGTYEVALEEISELEGFKFSTSPVSVKVKDKIEYKQIDVAAEVKTEAQVNVAKEDTAIQEAEAAPALKDTVEWVESTKTAVGSDSSNDTGEYEKVDRKEVTDPSTVSKVRSIFSVMETVSGNDAESESKETETPEPTPEPKPEPEPEPQATVSGVSVSGGSSIDIGKTVSLAAKVEGSNLSDSDKGVSWKSSDSSVATVNDSGVVTGVNAGKATITATSKKDGSKSGNCTITVNKAAVTITLNQSEISLKTGDSTSLTASVSSGSVKWTTSDEKIAKVENGKVTAIAAGTATITATSTEDTSKSATCKVTVTASATLTVKLDADSATVYTDAVKDLKATAAGANGTVTYSYASDATSVATVTSSAEKGTVKGVKAGTANITVTAKDASGTTATAVCKVTVKLNPKNDSSTKLKDKDGNQLYVKNSKDEYVEATYADYYKDVKLYRKLKNVTYKYTGWQTIDGKTYFYTKDGKPVTGEQVIQGAKYSFGSDGALVVSSSSGIMGIDVSKWNGTINWTAVKNSGVNYAIIRCGYRGSSTGALVQDPKFKANIQGAQAAGIKVGVYFFTQAVSEVEAVEEASMVLNLIKGYKLSYPVFLDVESSGGRGDSIDKGTRTSAVNAFCKTIQNGGRSAGVYANKTWFESKMNTGSLTGYKIWLAQYAAAPTYKATRHDIWQYTSKGKVSGISGNVDMNISYMG